MTDEHRVMWFLRKDLLVTPVPIVPGAAQVVGKKAYWLGANGRAYRTSSLYYGPKAAIWEAQREIVRRAASGKYSAAELNALALNIHAMLNAYS